VTAFSETYKDVIVEPLYDTVLYPAAGAALLSFFILPLGQGVSVFQTPAGVVAKTYADTNMQLAGQLSAGYYFKLLGFSVQPSFDVTDADLHGIWNGGVFTFTSLAKDFLKVPLRKIPQSNGPMGSGASMNSSGYPLLKNIYSIGNQPLDIGPSQSFGATLQWFSLLPHAATTADGANGGHTAGLPFTVYLDGFKYRPIQ
jgi:hypothetical protein